MLIEELKRARRSAGWTQSTLAARIDAAPQRIKRLEAGVGSVPTLVAAMAALNLRLSGIGPGATLPEQLHRRRCARSMPIAKAASLAGISRATVASLERGDGSVASVIRLLAAIAPRARRSAPERSYWAQGDKVSRDSRFTPPAFLAEIENAFGAIDLDPCAHELSPVVARRRILPSEGGDGLADAWDGSLVYMNPPFSDLLTWLKRAHGQWREGNVRTVVCLVPVRTDSAWFHETLAVDADIYLLRGRVRFIDLQGRAQPTPFSLMVITLGASAAQRLRFSERVPGYWMAHPATPPPGTGKATDF